MDRGEVSRLLDRAYGARLRQDVAAVLDCFCTDGRFAQNGAGPAATTRAEQQGTLQALFETYDVTDFREHCRVIDPPKAAVHWRARFHAKKTGESAETDILDLIEIRDGKIASLSTFFDTALAMRLQAK